MNYLDLNLKNFLLSFFYFVLLILFLYKNKTLLRAYKNFLINDAVMFILKLTKKYFILEILFTLGFSFFIEDINLSFLSFLVLEKSSGIYQTLFYIFGFFVTFTFFDYFHHAIQHTKIFWPIHRYHHSAKLLSPFTASRNHPFIVILEPFFRLFPLFIFANNYEIVLTILFLNLFYQPLVHSDINSNWGWFGKYVLFSPLHHRLHHSSLEEHYGKNLGIFPLWDHLFNTYLQPSKDKKINVGVIDKHYDSINFFKIFYIDLKESFGKVFNLLIK